MFAIYFQSIDSLPIAIRKKPRNCGPRDFFTPSDFEKEAKSKLNGVEWEQINILSEDGLMTLYTHVSFASFDQLSKEAGGYAACSVLAVIIARWLNTNKRSLPDRNTFDTLIKEGSMEWKNLLKNEDLKKAYPNGHFTINAASADIIDDNKSIMAHFQHKGIPEEVLQSIPKLRTFDESWEVVRKNSENDSFVYIVGWNDHFFLLKADKDACYLIDTLGSTLSHECERGYILKFDKDTKIFKKNELEREGGYNCCQYYIQNFLAARTLKKASMNYKKSMSTTESFRTKLVIGIYLTKKEV